MRPVVGSLGIALQGVGVYLRFDVFRKRVEPSIGRKILVVSLESIGM